MNLKKNNTILIIISIMIVTFTEIIGINMQIAFKYLPIFFAIITLVFLNKKLKEMTDKKHLIINIIIIVLNLVLTNLISGTFGYASILALLIFYKLIDKNNGLQFDKALIKNIIMWYIIPLVILLGIDAGYSKLISEISESSNYWMVNYNYLAMVTIYKIILANIVMVMLVIVFKEIIASKIEININSKTIIMIISAITLAVILCIKIILGYIGINDANSKIEKLNRAIQFNNLSTYYGVNLDSNLTVEDIGEVQEKERRYMVSFNEILTKGVSSWSELSYKLETNGIQDMVQKRTMNQKDALQKYNESAKKYVERLNIYKDNFTVQNISNIIIYLIDIIFIFVAYKKIEE